MKEIDDENATKANAIRGNAYTKHTTQICTNKYIEHVPSKRTITSMREKGIDKYANAQTIMCAKCTSNNIVAIEFSRRREHEPSTLRTFVRLFLLDYKRAKQSRQPAVRLQSVLCEVACEENSR